MTLFEPEPNPRKRLSALTWFGSWVVVTVIAACLHADPNGHGTHQQLGLMPCASALLMDRPCPGCGLTTSWTAFVHGDLPTAFRAHALGPFLYVAYSASAILTLIASVRGQRLITTSPKFNMAMYVLLGVFMTYGLGRMALTPHYAARHERLLSQFVHPFRAN